MYVQKRKIKPQGKKPYPTRYELTLFYTIKKLSMKHPSWDEETLYGVAGIKAFFVYLWSFPYGFVKKILVKKKVANIER